MPLKKEELYRKFLHFIFGIVIPAGIFYLPRLLDTDWRLPAGILGIITVILFLLEFSRTRNPAIQRFWYTFAGKAMRAKEANRVTGATYITAASFLCTVVFYKRPDIAAISLALFILGDGAAALAGQTFGRTRIRDKSLEGSLACFLLSLVLLLLVFPMVPALLQAWEGGIPVWIALAVSLAVTVLELFPFRLPGNIEVNDNLTVPLLSGLLMWGLYFLTYSRGI